MDMKTITIILTDGPYISEYGEIGCKIASQALRMSHVNIFLYLDAVHMAHRGHKPSLFAEVGRLLSDLAERGAEVRACARCSAARGYLAGEDGICPDFYQGIKITSLYDLAGMIEESDRVIALSG
ncbi:MAG TPA: DsrE family protein [Methanothrix sp.]|nr:DsrE family protein [Methanothrix sp.]